MRLRHRWTLRAAGLAAGWALPALIGTLSYRYRSLGPDLDPSRPGLDGRFIYAMWHEYLLMAVGRYARSDVHVLVSKHADGELVAEGCRCLGIPVVRGSSSRSGAEAVRQMLRAGRTAHLGLTPDGPRGPRRRVQQGLIYLAWRTGLPIVPVGFGLDRPWRTASWDRFAVPRPWSRGRCVTAAPIAVPAGAGPEEQEGFRVRVERALGLVTDAAERWAETGRWARPPEVMPEPAALAG